MCKVSRSTYAKIQTMFRGIKTGFVTFPTAVSRSFLSRRRGSVSIQSLLKAVAFSESLTTLIEYPDARTKSDITMELLAAGSFRYMWLKSLETSRWKKQRAGTPKFPIYPDSVANHKASPVGTRPIPSIVTVTSNKMDLQNRAAKLSRKY